MISNYLSSNRVNIFQINPNNNISTNNDFQNQLNEISINKNYQKKFSMNEKYLKNFQKIKYFETKLDVKFIDYKLEKFKNILDPDYIIKERYVFIPNYYYLNNYHLNDYYLN